MKHGLHNLNQCGGGGGGNTQSNPLQRDILWYFLLTHRSLPTSPIYTITLLYITHSHYQFLYMTHANIFIVHVTIVTRGTHCCLILIHQTYKQHCLSETCDMFNWFTLTMWHMLVWDIWHKLVCDIWHKLVCDIAHTCVWHCTYLCVTLHILAFDIWHIFVCGMVFESLIESY